MYIQTWYELECPNCESRNFLCLGDTTDLTGFDPDSCECWKCGWGFDMEGNETDVDCCDKGYRLEEVKNDS